MAREFGPKWTLGYCWVEVTILMGQFQGLALYAKRKGEEPVRRIVATEMEAFGWLEENRVPKRWAEMLLKAATAESSFQLSETKE